MNPLFSLIFYLNAQGLAHTVPRGEEGCHTSENLPGLISDSAHNEMLTCGVGRKGNSVRNSLACFQKGIPYVSRNCVFKSHLSSPFSLQGRRSLCWEYILRFQGLAFPPQTVDEPHASPFLLIKSGAMVSFTSSSGNAIRILFLVNKVTWELQRNVDGVVPTKSDHLFQGRTFLPQAQFVLSSFPSQLLLLNFVTAFRTE